MIATTQSALMLLLLCAGTASATPTPAVAAEESYLASELFTEELRTKPAHVGSEFDCDMRAYACAYPAAYFCGACLCITAAVIRVRACRRVCAKTPSLAWRDQNERGVRQLGAADTLQEGLCASVAAASNAIQRSCDALCCRMEVLSSKHLSRMSMSSRLIEP